MKRIAIFGAGGFGEEVFCIWSEMLKSRNIDFEFIGFFDDRKQRGYLNHYGKIAGNIHDLNSYPEQLDVCLAIGKPSVLYSISNSLTNPNIKYPNVIHPLFHELDANSICLGKGNVVSMEVIFSNKIQIGDFNIFNTRSTIGHDVHIGSYNIFSPNVQVSGSVQIGDMNLLGFNSGVIQGKRIGSGNVLGAGAILLSNIDNSNTYIGNPASKFKFNKEKTTKG